MVSLVDTVQGFSCSVVIEIPTKMYTAKPSGGNAEDRIGVTNVALHNKTKVVQQTLWKHV